MTPVPKLVRDRIPEILKRERVKFKSHVASSSEFRTRLEDKFEEEMQEFMEKRTVEELADVMEVILALAEDNGLSDHEFDSCMKSFQELSLSLGSSPEILHQVSQKKRLERGCFRERIILDSVQDAA